MRLIKAFTGSIESTLADQWIEIITAGKFDEHLLFAPGIILNRKEKTLRKTLVVILTNMTTFTYTGLKHQKMHILLSHIIVRHSWQEYLYAVVKSSLI